MLVCMLACDSKDTHINEGEEANADVPVRIKEKKEPERLQETKQESKPKGIAMQKINGVQFKSMVFDYTKHQEWVFAGDKPCIVDFYADWCGPCKMLSPRLEKIAKAYGGKINVYKVNIDEEQEIARTFGIQSIPTILLIPMEGQPQAAQGLMQEHELRRVVEEFLLK